MNILELIGCRVLLKIGGTSPFASQDVTEYKILEVSPSGNWVKLQNIYGNKFWRSIHAISFVEQLKDLNAGKPKE